MLKILNKLKGEKHMDKSDGVGGKHDKSVGKKSETSEDGGKVNKVNSGITLKFKCYY